MQVEVEVILIYFYRNIMVFIESNTVITLSEINEEILTKGSNYSSRLHKLKRLWLQRLQ